MRINPRFYRIALILYCILIFILSSIPGENFPKVDFEFSDKVVHLIVYGILFLLFFYSLKNQTKNAKLQKHSLKYSVLFTALYGITDELHQYFVPNRSCEFADWLADLTGAILVYTILKMYYSRKKNLIAAMLMLILFGCSGNSDSNRNEKVSVKITQEEAWLNLMPTVGSLNNIFGFTVSLNVSGTNSKNLSVKDLNIIFGNDTLYNKRFTTDNISSENGKIKLAFHQSNEERYVDNSVKPYPEEAEFVFTVYDGTNKLITTKTSKIKIQKVY